MKQSDLKITRSLANSEQAGKLAVILDGPFTADYIVAIVNSEPVTNNEVRARLARVKETLHAQGLEQMPSDAVLVSEILEQLIIEKAQLQTAKESGIKVEEFSVDQAIQNIAEQSGLGVEELLHEVMLRGQTEKSFREDIRNQLLIQRLQSRDVDSTVQVTEQDIDLYIAKQKQQKGDISRTSLNLGHILIAVAEDASPEEVQVRQQLAQQALQAARSEDDFAAVAKRFSDGGQAIFGMRPAERYPTLFLQTVGSASKGSVVGPVRSPAGFHILKVIDKESGLAPSVVTQTRARHILLRTSPQLGEQEAAQKLSELRQRIEAGASFGEIARQYSEDASAEAGGDLGWAVQGRYVPEFEQALSVLEPGQVSQPVVSRFGVHLIELVDRRQAVLTEREQREALRDELRKEKQEKALTTWIQELRGQAYVEYRDPPK